MKHAHLDTREHSFERVWTAEEIPVLRASVTLPLPDSIHDACTRRIQRYYRLQQRAFLRYCETQLYPLAARELQLALEAGTIPPAQQVSLGYQVTWNSGGVWSLYTQLQERTAAGQTHLRRWGDTWNLRSGYPMPLSLFFPPRHPWKRQLLQFAAEEIRRQEAAGMACYRQDWRRQLRKSFNARNYYLTEGGLVFLYPMYAIAPAPERIPTFCLPKDTAGLLLPGNDAKTP